MDVQTLFSVRGKVALVTGGSRGIGEMIAAGFLANGAKVYISSRKAAACDATAARLSDTYGGECIALPADVASVASIEQLAAALGERESKLDVLINNAGVSWGAPLDTFPEAGWDADCADTFDVSAVEEPTPIADDACNSCDRDFTAAFVLNEDKRNCPFDGYESLLDNDTTDRIDEEAYTLALMLDTNPLGGDPGEVSVWSYAQDDRDEATWIQRAMSIGTFTPDTAEDVTGPAARVWARSEGLCVTIEEE